MKMKLRTFVSVALAGLVVLFSAVPVIAGNCVSDGCHQNLINRRYLHGPVAAEQANVKACIACHVPEGPPCTKSTAGKFNTDKKNMCKACHAKGTGTQHSVETPNCLTCHDPHGSDTNPELLREGVKK